MAEKVERRLAAIVSANVAATRALCAPIKKVR